MHTMIHTRVLFFFAICRCVLLCSLNARIVRQLSYFLLKCPYGKKAICQTAKANRVGGGGLEVWSLPAPKPVNNPYPWSVSTFQAATATTTAHVRRNFSQRIRIGNPDATNSQPALSIHARRLTYTPRYGLSAPQKKLRIKIETRSRTMSAYGIVDDVFVVVLFYACHYDFYYYRYIPRAKTKLKTRTFRSTGTAPSLLMRFCGQRRPRCHTYTVSQKNRPSLYISNNSAKMNRF